MDVSLTRFSKSVNTRVDVSVGACKVGSMDRRKLRDFAERLSQAVEEVGGPRVVAFELRITYVTLFRWMQGTREPSLYWLCVLAAYLGLKPNELLGCRKGRIDEANRLGCDVLFSEIKRARQIDDADPLDRLHRARLKRMEQEGEAIKGIRERNAEREIAEQREKIQDVQRSEFPVKPGALSFPGEGRVDLFAEHGDG